jgi:hypothetical protein
MYWKPTCKTPYEINTEIKFYSKVVTVQAMRKYGEV